MPPRKDKKRKELHFTESELKQFKKMADADGRSLKGWMEMQLRKLLKKR
jgi:hypothetical protein